jgi:hypothetical protein
MFYSAANVVWQWVPSLVVIMAFLLRFAYCVKRRRARCSQDWQPAEIVLVRSLAVLITGRQVTGITWKYIDALVLALLLIALAGGFHDSVGITFQRSSVRQAGWHSPLTDPSPPAH